MFEKCALPKTTLRIIIRGPFRYTKMLQILFFDRSRKSTRAKDGLLKDYSLVYVGAKIIGSRVTIHNVELKVRMKKRRIVCYIFLDTSTTIKSAGVVTRQIDFSIPSSARNSLSVAHAKLPTRPCAIVRSIRFRNAFLYYLYLK